MPMNYPSAGEQAVEDILREGVTKRTKIGVISDIHWNDEGGRTLIEDLADIKDNLDIFIDDMNNSFEADVVIYLGDLVDQNLAADATDYENLLGDATDYLENSGGPSGNGLNAPIHYVAGNHEAEYSDYGVWSELGFSSYSDTYYSLTINDYEIIVLNTAGTDSRGTAPSAHIFRSEEIDWLENKLSENDKPKLVFMHIPPFEPIKSKDYDTVENERKVMDLLMGEPSVIEVFFGHMHHDQEYNRLRSDAPGALHVCSPNYFYSDTTLYTSITPYARVFLRTEYKGVSDWGRVEASYIGNGKGEREQWNIFGSFDRPTGLYAKENAYLRGGSYLVGDGYGLGTSSHNELVYFSAPNMWILGDGTDYTNISIGIAGTGQHELDISPNTIELLEAGIFDIVPDEILLEADTVSTLSLGKTGSGQRELRITGGKTEIPQGTDFCLPTRGSDPGTAELNDGQTCIYVSDGSADVTGDDGDVILAVNSGGTIKTKILADFSAL